MSGKKFEPKFFTHFYKKYWNKKNREFLQSNVPGITVLTLNEFNKLFFGNGNVVIRYKKGGENSAYQTVSFYEGVRSAFKQTKFVNYWTWSELNWVCISERQVYDEKVLPKNKQSYNDLFFDGINVRSHQVKDFWWKNTDEFVISIPRKTACTIHFPRCKSLKTMEEIVEFSNPNLIDNIFGRRGKKRVIIFWEICENDEFDKYVNDGTLKKFQVFNYGPEKEFIDSWMAEHDSILDPMFDAKLVSNKGFDKLLLYRYVAFNYNTTWREYAKFYENDIKDVIMPKEEFYSYFK